MTQNDLRMSVGSLLYPDCPLTVGDLTDLWGSVYRYKTGGDDNSFGCWTSGILWGVSILWNLYVILLIDGAYEDSFGVKHTYATQSLTDILGWTSNSTKYNSVNASSDSKATFFKNILIENLRSQQLRLMATLRAQYVLAWVFWLVCVIISAWFHKDFVGTDWNDYRWMPWNTGMTAICTSGYFFMQSTASVLAIADLQAKIKRNMERTITEVNMITKGHIQGGIIPENKTKDSSIESSMKTSRFVIAYSCITTSIAVCILCFGVSGWWIDWDTVTSVPLFLLFVGNALPVFVVSFIFITHGKIEFRREDNVPLSDNSSTNNAISTISTNKERHRRKHDPTPNGIKSVDGSPGEVGDGNGNIFQNAKIASDESSNCHCDDVGNTRLSPTRSRSEMSTEAESPENLKPEHVRERRKTERPKQDQGPEDNAQLKPAAQHKEPSEKLIGTEHSVAFYFFWFFVLYVLSMVGQIGGSIWCGVDCPVDCPYAPNFNHNTLMHIITAVFHFPLGNGFIRYVQQFAGKIESKHDSSHRSQESKHD